jgi:hypothetical protein
VIGCPEDNCPSERNNQQRPVLHRKGRYPANARMQSASLRAIGDRWNAPRSKIASPRQPQESALSSHRGECCD